MSRANGVISWTLSRGSLVVVSCLSLMASMTLPTTSASACGAPRPPIIQCSPTLSLLKAGMQRVRVPTNLINVGYCFRPSVFKPCPPGAICIPCAPILNVTVTMQIRTLGGVVVGTNTVVIPAGSITDNALNCPPGGINVPVAGPGGGLLGPGLYAVRGTATMTLTDGTTVVARGDTCISIVEETAPGSGVPRLDLEHLTPDEVAVHPGDVQENVYRVINNDPDESVTISFSATNTQNARLAEITEGPGVPAMFERSYAEPFSGDSFAIAIGEDCPDLPPDPGNTPPQTVVEVYTIDPLDSLDVPVRSRGFPLCTTGSGCEQIVELQATWAGGDTAEACVGGVTETDHTILPAFACPDAGARMFPFPLGPGVLGLDGTPAIDKFFGLDLVAQPPEISVNGKPLFPEIEAINDGGKTSTPEHGRLIYAAQLPPLPSGGQLSGFLPIQVFGFQADVLGVQLMPMPGVPGGFEQITPTSKGGIDVALLDPDGNPTGQQAVAEVLAQMIGELEQPQNTLNPGQVFPFDQVTFTGLEGSLGGAGIGVGFDAFVPPTSGPTRVLLSFIVRGYARGAGPSGCNLADLAPPFGTLDLADVSAFVGGFVGQDPIADLNNDGLFDLTDVGLFVGDFTAGCP